MFQWKKLGKVFDPSTYSELPWISEYAQAPCVVHHQGFLRVYFSCRPKPDSNGQYISYSSYVDLETLPPFRIMNIADKPILELGKRGCFDEFGTYPVSVIQDGTIHRAWYGGWTRCKSVPFDVAIGEAISDDGGKTFQKLGLGPVLAATRTEPFIISGPKVRNFHNRWYLYYIAGRNWRIHDQRPEPTYKIRLAVSDDGHNWHRIERDLIPSYLENDEAQASPDVFLYNGYYHMFFCYRYSTDYKSKIRGYRIGYAYSKNLIEWFRMDEWAGITVSDKGWDSEMISYPHVFESENRVFLFYLGNNFGRYGFGAAELISFTKPASII